MLLKGTVGLAAILLPFTNACPDHNLHQKRQSDSELDWSYGNGDNANNWGHINPDYETCAIGTQQSPVSLYGLEGYSERHTPKFDYPSSVEGVFANSGNSLIFTVTPPDDITTLPSVRFQESDDSDPEEVYLIGWHTHAPSEHIVDGQKAKAEMHFVHVDADENFRSVFSFLINPSNGTQSAFFDQLDQPFPPIGSDNERTSKVDLNLALNDIGGFDKFWTYHGSLTTPPCTEGLRWFVAKEPLLVDNDMLQEILRVSMYSARPVQQMWMQGVNE
ncbi:hypothetical protein LTR37_006317 [Vermiconidia calcicola]|uniref:Uncharacterized protein n=1 Tax=Vermiconidia calcicola TaxID=1690605 RepID=A0ACC3NI37_9PEZI|nr:hypothetical protein LTR37_006317 [Vermiconidia calcicola]